MNKDCTTCKNLKWFGEYAMHACDVEKISFATIDPKNYSCDKWESLKKIIDKSKVLDIVNEYDKLLQIAYDTFFNYIDKTGELLILIISTEFYSDKIEIKYQINDEVKYFNLPYEIYTAPDISEDLIKNLNN
jgi:hypothetical protein